MDKTGSGVVYTSEGAWPVMVGIGGRADEGGDGPDVAASPVASRGVDRLGLCRLLLKDRRLSTRRSNVGSGSDSRSFARSETGSCGPKILLGGKVMLLGLDALIASTVG